MELGEKIVSWTENWRLVRPPKMFHENINKNGVKSPSKGL